ncbi:MAG: hypothetical protein C0485_12530 [Pirellula sp.]|nr:hypothetical protein [Pirellula sp.]
MNERTSASIATIETKRIVLDIRGAQLAYDFATQELSFGESKARAPLVDGKLTLRVLSIAPPSKLTPTMATSRSATASNRPQVSRRIT